MHELTNASSEEDGPVYPPPLPLHKRFIPSVEEYEALIGRRLRALRTSRGWPMKRVAYELGVSTATVSAWESGHRFPSGGSLFLLASLYSITPCQLICAGTALCPNANSCHPDAPTAPG